MNVDVGFGLLDQIIKEPCFLNLGYMGRSLRLKAYLTHWSL